MKGLLIKDYKLTSRGDSIFNMIFIAIVYGALAVADVDSYSGYTGICFLAVLWSVGIRNYDVCDNGLAYLLTMPVTRREYVREAYLFSLCSACVEMLIYCLLDRTIRAILPLDNDYASFVFFGGIMWNLFKSILLMIAFLTPFYLFFGAKKRNLYVLIVVGIVFMLVIFYESMPLYGVITKGENLLMEFPVTLTLLAVSYLLSVRIMERKDF